MTSSSTRSNNHQTASFRGGRILLPRDLLGAKSANLCEDDGVAIVSDAQDGDNCILDECFESVPMSNGDRTIGSLGFSNARPFGFVNSVEGYRIASNDDVVIWNQVASLTSCFANSTIDLDRALNEARIEFSSGLQIKSQPNDDNPASGIEKSFDNFRITESVTLPASLCVRHDLNGLISITGTQLDQALTAFDPINNCLIWYGAIDSNPYNGAYTFSRVGAGIDFAMTRVKESCLTPGGRWYERPTLSGMSIHYASDQN
ncbi:hypothetical protein SH528x_005476 [Novipirellula sp. SH528]|uniref:hypothetical protein n=1 Tax=Novipirellula sp. SH528 TaxID=3454466 RepID=UPI003FA11872